MTVAEPDPGSDTTPPELTLPADITEEATGPSGAAVSYDASATGDVDGDVAVQCTPASGDTFAVGDTTVECSATDAAGNTAQGSFQVTVTPTNAPPLTANGGGGPDTCLWVLIRRSC